MPQPDFSYWKSCGSVYRTPLGDTVSTVMNEAGEHITVEVRPSIPLPLALALEYMPKLELAPDPAGLTDWQRYNARYRK
jgi:hypothetical protein